MDETDREFNDLCSEVDEENKPRFVPSRPLTKGQAYYEAQYAPAVSRAEWLSLLRIMKGVDPVDRRRIWVAYIRAHREDGGDAGR